MYESYEMSISGFQLISLAQKEGQLGKKKHFHRIIGGYLLDRKTWSSSKDERRAFVEAKKHSIKLSLDKKRRASGQDKNHGSSRDERRAFAKRK